MPKKTKAPSPREGLSDDKLRQLDKLAERLENSGVYEYVRMQKRTGKILWLNFLSGVARGLGFTVGTAIVLALAYKVLKHLINMNIPYLTEVLTELISYIKGVGG